MNKKQREKLEEVCGVIETVLEEENDKLSNMEENFSETQRFQEMEEKRDTLEEVKSSLEEVLQ